MLHGFILSRFKNAIHCLLVCAKFAHTAFALGIVTPWGGTEVSFYEVGRERSEPGNP